MKQSGQISRGGFTLIELLTVIAIIGILAALTAAVLPRALERAKVVNIESTMNQVKIVLVDYFADHGSYPAAYGYVNDGGRGLPAAELLDAIHRVYRPYMYTAGEFNDFDLYDNFGKDGGDTNRDGNIGFLEFSPVGTRSGASAYTFVPEIYNGSNLPTEVSAQLRAHRPLIYIPVNRRQVKQAESYWYSINPDDPRPRATDPAANSPFATMTFPPANYDAAVLISLGPDGNTRGLLPEPGGLPAAVTNGVAPAYAYHVLGIVAYFMASRDADASGALDFDFRGRTRGGEAKNPNNQLPDPLAPNGQGPMILVIE